VLQQLYASIDYFWNSCRQVRVGAFVRYGFMAYVFVCGGVISTMSLGLKISAWLINWSERLAFTPNGGFNPITCTSNGTTKSSANLRTEKSSKLIRNCEWRTEVKVKAWISVQPTNVSSVGSSLRLTLNQSRFSKLKVFCFRIYRPQQISLIHDKAPLQAPIYVQNKTKSTKETFEEKYTWLIKTYFWSKDVIIPVLAIALPSTCKSLVHQNGKVIRATAEVDNLFSQKHKC